MPKNASQQIRSKSQARPADGKLQTLPPPNTRNLRILGAAFLLVSIGMSLALVLLTLGGIKVPGCGPGGGCADLSNGFWGSLRWGDFKWPASYLGLAYFVAVLVAWLATPGGVAPLFRWLLRFGVVISVAFIMVMIKEKHFCPYCVGAHAGNIAFWIVAEATRWRPIGAARPIGIYLVAYAVATAGLAVADSQIREKVSIKEESELQGSINEMVKATEAEKSALPKETPKPQTPAGQPSTQPAQAPAPVPAPPSTQPVSSATKSEAAPDPRMKVQMQPAQKPSETPPPASSQPASKPASKPAEKPVPTSKPPLPPGWEWQTILSQDDPFKDGFVGRYLKGPREAAVRIVMFTDYQCPDCKRIEGDIESLLEKYPNDVSLSVKLFPFDQSCNPTADRTLHPNACWAARAAEAAGILWGNEGYWKMHTWLFDRSGIFETTKVLEDGVRSLGYDPKGYVQVVTGDETRQRIESDIKEARWCGIYQTPMLFINGHELRGWRTPNAVPRAVEALLQRRPPARDHSQDHPPIALEKMVGDWRENPRRPTPPDNPRRSVGPDNAPVQVVMYGDFEEPTTAETDIWFREYVGKHTDTQYTYRDFPFSQECNRCMKFTKFDQSCWAAKAAEAAGKVKGDEGYWAIHDWLMRHQDAHNDDALRQAATEAGIDADALLAAMSTSEVADAIADDVNGADKVSLQAIPLIIINGKQVGRWRVIPERSAEVLEMIIDEAAGRRQTP
jgi:protein-disulfide isomerase/uncharacterized membrane protein